MKPSAHPKYTGLLAVILALLASAAFPQHFDFKKYPENPEVNNAFIYSLSNDSLGYIWIGTAEGLIRFNGKSFHTFTTSDSLADNFISVTFNEGMLLWIGHMNGSVSLYDHSRFRKIYPGSEDSGPVTCFGKDPGGSVWMGTYNGKLIRLGRNASATTVKIPDGNASLHGFVFVDDETILAATSSGLILYKITSAGNLIISKELTVASQITSVIEGFNRNDYYAASANEIYRINRSFQIVDTIRDIQGIQSISTDRFNHIWIATFGAGLINYDPGTHQYTSFTDAGENIKTVFEGKDGNIWAGGYGSGLTRLSAPIFRWPEYRKDLYGYAIAAICHERNTTWIGTEKGILTTDLDGNPEGFNGSLKKISAICRDGSGNTWIGTESDGVYILSQNNKLKKVPISEGNLEQSVTAMIFCQGHVWAGTRKGLCRISDSGTKIKWYTISDGLPHNLIAGLYKDNEDRLWISTRSNIITFLKDEKIERVILPGTNPAITVRNITEDSKSFLWAATLGMGVYRLQQDSVLNVNSNTGLFSDYCYAITRDDHDHLWVVHKDGLSRINCSNYYIRAFNSFDGNAASFISNAVSLDEEGKIWVGTEDGVLIIDQSKETTGIPPVPDILSIRINNETYNPNQGRIRLRPGKYAIEIEYGAISQKDPDMVLYTVFLEGYDQQPEMTRKNSVEYRNLTEGSFIFTVSALNGDGIESGMPDKLEIWIRKPLLKQWWFYLILLFIAGGLVIGYIKRREFIFNQERKILEEKVMERTREIQARKDEIEKQRDLIRLKNAEITSSIRYALEIQSALLPPESKFDRYFPENFIFIKPKDIVSGDFYWLARKNDRIIFTVADCTGHGVPGGFMSMLSISILNEIVNVEGITESDKIVNRLHTLIHKSLNRSRADGLDMALCSYDWTNRVIQFTGAMNHLVYFRNGERNILKADQYSVNMTTDEAVIFTSQELKLQKGDMVYLYSDGFMDQFGGEKDKKFSVKRFYNLLQDIHQMPVKDQETILDQNLIEWKKDRVQTDDITIMGIRF